MYFLTSTNYINKCLSNKQFINKKSFLLPKEQHLTIPLREPLGMGMRFGAGGHLHQIQRLSSCTLVMSPKLWNCECLCQAYLSSKTPTCVPRDIRREKKMYYFEWGWHGLPPPLKQIFSYNLSFGHTRLSASRTWPTSTVHEHTLTPTCPKGPPSHLFPQLNLKNIPWGNSSHHMLL